MDLQRRFRNCSDTTDKAGQKQYRSRQIAVESLEPVKNLSSLQNYNFPPIKQY
ncbi:hypothetical protein D3C86_1329750 [compost metagenome]